MPRGAQTCPCRWVSPTPRMERKHRIPTEDVAQLPISSSSSYSSGLSKHKHEDVAKEPTSSSSSSSSGAGGSSTSFKRKAPDSSPSSKGGKGKGKGKGNSSLLGDLWQFIMRCPYTHDATVYQANLQSRLNALSESSWDDKDDIQGLPGLYQEDVRRNAARPRQGCAHHSVCYHHVLERDGETYSGEVHLSVRSRVPV
jgi:hypothetical protein